MLTLSNCAQELARRADISYTRFVRTSDPVHIAGVQHLWVRPSFPFSIFGTAH